MAKRLGLFLAGFLAAFAPRPASASYDRRTWIFEQLATPPLPPIVEEMKNQIRIGGTNYGDTLSSQVSLLANARWVEIGGKLSSRLYGNSDEGKSLHAQTDGIRTTFTVEIARSYVSRLGHYGRFGLEYVHFAPTRYRLIRVGFNTGILETADNPYFIRLNISSFRKMRIDVPEDGNLVYAGGEIGRRYEAGKNSQWRTGGSITWTYRTNGRVESLSTVGRYEHMLFTFGPFVEYVTGALHVRLAIPWRLWMDREIIGIPNAVTGNTDYVSTHPQKVGLPDVSFSMTLVL